MKFFVLLSFSLMSISAFSQTCYVDMVNRFGRVVATFTGFGDPSVCFEGMKECRKAIRMSPHLGGVDCVRDSGRGGGHIPVPGRGPVPIPVPAPYPLQSVEVISLISDLAASVFAAEGKIKIISTLINQTGSPALFPLLRICEGVRSTFERLSCLESGIKRAPIDYTSEPIAIQAVGQACSNLSSTLNQQSCFQSSFKRQRFPSLSLYSQSCSQIWSTQDSVNCFMRLFRVF